MKNKTVQPVRLQRSVEETAPPEKPLETPAFPEEEEPAGVERPLTDEQAPWDGADDPGVTPGDTDPGKEADPGDMPDGRESGSENPPIEPPAATEMPAPTEQPEEADPEDEEGQEPSEHEEETEEHAVSAVELVLDENGKIPADTLRQYLQQGTLISGPGEKLSLSELLPRLPISVFAIAGAVLALAVVEACVISFLSRKAGKQEAEAVKDKAEPVPVATSVLAGSLSNIGGRQSQQDSHGMARVQNGLFAVVADGMGGLSDGDRVSQQIVQTMLADAGSNSLNQLRGNLDRMVAHANDDVDRLLGPRDQYVSGSTLIAVLAEPECFQWVSVGDSRIYLYRGGVLLQLNREHIYESELLLHAVNGEVSFQEAHAHSKRGSVSSFIGMGKLKYIDEPLRPVAALPGDMLLLTSDGVFNTLSEGEISNILRLNPDPAVAARELEAAVLNKANPYQDNFSSVILSWR